MSNELLFILELVFVFGSLLLVKKIFGRIGIMAWVPIAAILANIQVTKSVDFLGIQTAMGNILFASSFLATDILSEYYDKKSAKKAVLLSAVGMLFFVAVSQITLLFTPNELDMAQPAMESLFTLSLRTTTASLIMYLVANAGDVWLFHKLSKLTKGKHLWLRNNIATIVCNCLENYGFAFLAFFGIFEVNDILIMATMGSVIEIIIALLDTPFLYLAKHIKNKEEKCLK